jgi:hypothetical protein
MESAQRKSYSSPSFRSSKETGEYASILQYNRREKVHKMFYMDGKTAYETSHLAIAGNFRGTGHATCRWALNQLQLIIRRL